LAHTQQLLPHILRERSGKVWKQRKRHDSQVSFEDKIVLAEGCHHLTPPALPYILLSWPSGTSMNMSRLHPSSSSRDARKQKQHGMCAQRGNGFFFLKGCPCALFPILSSISSLGSRNKAGRQAGRREIEGRRGEDAREEEKSRGNTASEAKPRTPE
jgi:hypothetical protein